jgi:uncharacterized protein YPO0396
MTVVGVSFGHVEQLELMNRQWRTESLQMVNWGGFEGHHKINFAATATLLSGSSGTGKSTLLDAYIALMMDSNVSFNGASNDSATGRARSNEQRSVLSYVRGKVDMSRESGTGQLTDEVLRGRDASTWSAVAMTWRNDLGERFTALRIYFAPISASQFGDMTMHMAVIDRAFDLFVLEEFAAERFPHRRLSARFDGLTFYDTYQTFAATLHVRLGIGMNGDGARALKLLARIQGGRQVTTVDGLYKSMVLEEPRTFVVADRAINHFDDLKASYDTMKNAEAQVKVLDAIPEVHRTLLEAEAEAVLIDTYKVHSTEKNTPFALWSRRLEAELLGKTVSQNREKYRNATEQFTQGNRDAIATKGEVADIRERQSANGGDALNTIERALESLQQGFKAVAIARTLFDERIEILNRAVTTQDEFDELRCDSENFIASFVERQTALEDENNQSGMIAYPLLATQSELNREFDSLRGREGLVPHDLHAARLTVAQALGVDPLELPFVAELLDMAPRYEEWRQAAELALGGFAVTMLVDQSCLARVRREINSIRMKRRLKFEGADLHQPLRTFPSSDVLPGRFITKDTPFTSWLINRLADRFNYTCVDRSEDLDSTQIGLTITGQTKQNRQGAHGGHGAAGVIGFSNSGRLEEISQDLASIQTELIKLEKKRLAIAARGHDLMQQRDAHRQVADITWSSIDVTSLEIAIEEKEHSRERLLKASDVLKQLKDEEERLTKRLEDLQFATRSAGKDGSQLDIEHGALVAKQDEVNSHLWEMEEDETLAMGETQNHRLNTEFELIEPDPALESFGRSMNALKSKLALQNLQARKDVDNATKILRTTFMRFQEQWARPNLGTEVDSYEGYRDILDELIVEGLHERREKWSHQVNEWSGVDLLALNHAYNESIDEIETRLDPVNEILSRLPFGAGRDRLHITLRRVEGKDIGEFRKELKILSSGTTVEFNYEEAEIRFRRLQKFIDKIRRSNKLSEREYFIDVRKHVYIEAERRDTGGRQLGVYTSLGGKSGGETQELIAFIVGAALRYQLGDVNLSRPRYAPVLLDEGFIKSDSEFAGRAVLAWQGLGFQLIIGSPNDKVTAIEPYMDLLLQVTKNQKNHSHVLPISPHAPAPIAEMI